MSSPGLSLEKSRLFAVRIVRLCHFLRAEKREFVLADQILRSGTSIGANLTEAQYAISRKDFSAKLYIALKECAETQYWLDLLQEAGCLSAAQYQSLSADCSDLLHILQASTKTLTGR